MWRSIVLVFFVTTVSTSSTWTRFGSKCFQYDNRHVTQPKAMKICREMGAALTSISNQKELDFIKGLLVMDNQCWVWASRKLKDFQWENGDYCCPQSWWAPSEPSDNKTCARFKKTKGDLWAESCDKKLGFMCSKSAKTFTKVKSTDYYYDHLCGVEIMPNCEDLSCRDVCESHPNCDQYAAMLNVCVNVKNVTRSNNCIVKMRPNMELYNSKFIC